jgi:hypothetical protein
MIKTLPIEGNIGAPVLEFQAVHGKSDSLFIEKDRPPLFKMVPAPEAVRTVLHGRVQDRLSAAHAERLPDIGKLLPAAHADLSLGGEQDRFTDGAARGIEQIQEKGYGIRQAAQETDRLSVRQLFFHDD